MKGSYPGYRNIVAGVARMNFDQGTLIHAAVAGVIGLFMLSAARTQPIADPRDGSLRFRYNLLFRGTTFVFAFVVPLAFAVLLLIIPVKSDEDFWATIGMSAFVIGTGFLFRRESSRFALIVSPAGLDCRSPWFSSKFIAWQDVEEVSFSSINQWFVIRAIDGRRFRVHRFVDGLPVFLDLCEKNLSADRLRRARVGYFHVGRAFPGK
jgi:hypothetical protein